MRVPFFSAGYARPVKCSFCGRSGDEVRLFSGRPVARADGTTTPFVCEVCIRELGQKVPDQKEPDEPPDDAS